MQTIYTDNSSAAPMGIFLDITLLVRAVLGQRQMKVSELLTLGVGSVVELPKQAGAHLDLQVQDRRIAQGEPVLVGDTFGVQVSEVCSASGAMPGGAMPGAMPGMGAMSPPGPPPAAGMGAMPGASSMPGASAIPDQPGMPPSEPAFSDYTTEPQNAPPGPYEEHEPPAEPPVESAMEPYPEPQAEPAEEPLVDQPPPLDLAEDPDYNPPDGPGIVEACGLWNRQMSQSEPDLGALLEGLQPSWQLGPIHDEQTGQAAPFFALENLQAEPGKPRICILAQVGIFYEMVEPLFDPLDQEREHAGGMMVAELIQPATFYHDEPPSIDGITIQQLTPDRLRRGTVRVQ